MDSRSLDDLQRWFQTVVTHPAGVQQAATDLNDLLTASSQQSAEDRVAVYARSYWARLLECLREEHPLVRAAVGDAAFDALAVGYLQACPSTSYTLAQLGERFAAYLAEHRPDDDFSAAVVELARLERNINEVFDLAGGETLGFLGPDDLAAVPVERRADVRLAPLPTFRLLSFEHDVNDWYTRLRAAAGEVQLPARRPSYVALSRREFIIRRHPLSAIQAALLQAISDGAPLGDAIAIAVEQHPADLDELAASLQTWFAAWAAAGFFRGIAP